MSSLTDRVKCETCLWGASVALSGCRQLSGPCDWTDRETGETVADLALQLRLARARAERCAGCALFCPETGCHYSYEEGTATLRDGWCIFWQPGQPAPKEETHE